jgi:methionyl-tRNA formyltransferase
MGADIRLVITRPEDPSLADQTSLTEFTDRHEIELRREESVNSSAVKDAITATDPELLFVVGWSRLVDQEVIAIPSVAALGMHPAPLPRGRGRAPLAWSIIKGLDQTCLTMFHLVEKADAGDIVGQRTIPIELEDHAGTVYEKMVEAGRELVRSYYPTFESGDVPRTSQDDSKATWWPKREPHHGLIDWNRPPRELYDWIRGLTRPYPGAFSFIEDVKVTVWAANPPSDSSSFAQPGEITHCVDDGIGIGAWEGILEVTEVQVEDDDPVPANELIESYPFEVGDVFVNARDRLK